MLGSRAIYDDGWKAVTFHTPPFIAYDGSDTTKPFDDDVWELYHVAEDFSEVNDVADAHPEKLAALQALWWKEAERYQALPLNNLPILHGDTRYRRERHVFYPGIGPLSQVIAPDLRNRAFQIAAELDIPADGETDGVIVAHGGHAGGYALYIAGRRLHYTYNFLGSQITTVSASVELPSGGLVTRAAFTLTAPFAGEVELSYDDVPVGRGVIPRTTPITYGVVGFAVGYQPGGPVVERLGGRAEIPGGVLRRVVVEVVGKRHQDPAGEERAGLAMQ
jgi:arylsulfatase